MYGKRVSPPQLENTHVWDFDLSIEFPAHSVKYPAHVGRRICFLRNNLVLSDQ